MKNLEEMALAAKRAAYDMAKASADQKNDVLRFIIEGIKKRKEEVLQENRIDVDEAKASGLSDAMLDRLSIQNKLEGILSDVEQVIQLPDPIGECFEQQVQGDLHIKKCRTPLGVLGVIYESRPNVTIDISVLTLKSGNCAILRGGSESLRTNKILVDIIQEALEQAKMPVAAIQLIPRVDRTEIHKMLRLHAYIDLIIPRGGAELHRFCRENSTIPVITGGVGVCHLFVDESADLKKSLSVIVNAKTQRPTVCNALDTLLVHEKIAERFIPQMMGLLAEKGVQFRMDASSLQIAQSKNAAAGYAAAQPQDWDMEWLGLVLGVKVVRNLQEAVEHIREHSTGHSDGILTQDKVQAERFVAEVDSAAVYVNASTRFTDGGQLGLGAEVAISTQKLHARGPMGLRELTSYKWVISGDYAIRN